ncbi:hypothetical protein [Daejeonia sp. YH14]|uniref:hypothetical protein n=1 Tax=Daejeonia sp. YH14 TaxID=3439042 RepID=UPI003F49976D
MSSVISIEKILTDECAEEIIGKHIDQLLPRIKLPLVSAKDSEYVFFVGKYFFGLFEKRLYLFLDNRRIVTDYYVG